MSSIKPGSKLIRGTVLCAVAIGAVVLWRLFWSSPGTQPDPSPDRADRDSSVIQEPPKGPAETVVIRSQAAEAEVPAATHVEASSAPWVVRGMVTDGDRALSGAEVSARIGTASAVTQTSPDGRYRLEVPRSWSSGKVYVRASCPGHCSRTEVFESDVRTSTDPLDQDFVLRRGADLRGAVRYLGATIEEAVITVSSGDSGQSAHLRTWTDDLGQFELGLPADHLLSKDQTIAVYANHGQIGTAEVVVAKANLAGRRVDLELVPCSRVALRIVDHAGNGLPGVPVEAHVVGTELLTARRGASVWTSNTDAGGAVELRGMGQGALSIRLPFSRGVSLSPSTFDPDTALPVQQIAVNGVVVRVVSSPADGAVRLRWFSVGEDGTAKPWPNQFYAESKVLTWVLPPGTEWIIEAETKTRSGRVQFKVPDYTTSADVVVQLRAK